MICCFTSLASRICAVVRVRVEAEDAVVVAVEGEPHPVALLVRGVLVLQHLLVEPAAGSAPSTCRPQFCERVIVDCNTGGAPRPCAAGASLRRSVELRPAVHREVVVAESVATRAVPAARAPREEAPALHGRVGQVEGEAARVDHPHPEAPARRRGRRAATRGQHARGRVQRHQEAVAERRRAPRAPTPGRAPRRACAGPRRAPRGRRASRRSAESSHTRKRRIPQPTPSDTIAGSSGALLA